MGVFDLLHIYQGTPAVPMLNLFGRNGCESMNNSSLPARMRKEDDPKMFPLIDFSAVCKQNPSCQGYIQQALGTTLSFSI